MVQSKKISLKSYYLCITNKEITQIPKSESKKFSILCTFKGKHMVGISLLRFSPKVHQMHMFPVRKSPTHISFDGVKILELTFSCSGKCLRIQLIDSASIHRLAESIPWNRFLGSRNVYKFGLSDLDNDCILIFREQVVFRD
jgi:hypothetical protein